MGFLPCLRRGSDRWWLPLSSVATETLGQIVLSASQQINEVDSQYRSLNRQVASALQIDPPLMIFAALSWPGEEASLSDLADWLIANVTGALASGDAFMGAPQIVADQQRRWNKLRDHYRTLATANWIDDAELWLEVTGPRVSNTWKQQWPTIAIDEEQLLDDATPPSGSKMLQQLARKMQRQQSLERSFDIRLHKSKLGALKQLAYGLSHEINNPLANISTRAQQLQRNEDDPTRHAVLQRIVDQVYRAHEMIADLMFYANPPRPEVAESDLNGIIESVTEGFSEEAQRQAIRLEVETYNDGSANFSVDAVMIGEAIRALIRNAIDAIGCEGTIVVSLVRQDERWLIHIADSGPGLSRLARDHAFDPYFSGREAGRGLGLGLCRAYRIAKLHSGEVTLAGGPTGCVATIMLRV
ncbi:sensor histidine kinase [Planctomycetes bacterium K23_9]|uniref:histidine kinase n=1 Tax=Stieleria marina TaxID=1930275 RepID=A0A517NNY6_9BACT|nr:Sensor protein ZraS [Planctomycetes bacterium K23_9]